METASQRESLDGQSEKGRMMMMMMMMMMEEVL